MLGQSCALSHIIPRCSFCTNQRECVGASLKTWEGSCILSVLTIHNLRIYPYPMVWPLPRPWSETMVSIPLRTQKALQIKGFLGLERPFWIWSRRPRAHHCQCGKIFRLMSSFATRSKFSSEWEGMQNNSDISSKHLSNFRRFGPTTAVHWRE